MDSLFYKSKDALELLLASRGDYTETNSYGDPFLHQLAIYGGMGTLKIVHEAKLRDLDIHAINKNGKTAQEIALSREDSPEGFFEAFEILLASIEARTAKQAPGSVEIIDVEDVGRFNIGSGADSTDVLYNA